LDCMLGVLTRVVAKPGDGMKALQTEWKVLKVKSERKSRQQIYVRVNQARHSQMAPLKP